MKQTCPTTPGQQLCTAVLPKILKQDNIRQLSTKDLHICRSRLFNIPTAQLFPRPATAPRTGGPCQLHCYDAVVYREVRRRPSKLGVHCTPSTMFSIKNQIRGCTLQKKRDLVLTLVNCIRRTSDHCCLALSISQSIHVVAILHNIYKLVGALVSLVELE